MKSTVLFLYHGRNAREKGVLTMDEKKYDEKIDEELETTVETKEENEITDSNEESTNDKKKKIKILSAVLAVILVIAAVITGTVGCNTSNKDVEYEVTQIKKEVEYTSEGKPVDPLSLVYIGEKTDKKATKAGIDENLEATAYPVNIDTSRVGDIEVTYTVTDKKSGESKKITSTFEVVNSDAPVFKTTDKTKEIAVGDKFDPESLVKDDGGCKQVDEEPSKNEDGTYDEAWYTVTSNVKTDKAGTYSVKFHAVGTNGVASDSEVTITVTEKTDESTKDESKTASKKDTKTAAKADSKKTDKKSDTANSKNNKTADKTNGATASKNNNNTSSGSASSSTQTQQKPAEKKCHDVYHDAEGHWETVVTGQKWIQDTEDVVTEKYKCNKCGQVFTDPNLADEHGENMSDAGDGGHSWSPINEVIPGTGHYEDITEQKYVIDKQAWTETVCE